jgi:hypothetical protein
MAILLLEPERADFSVIDPSYGESLGKFRDQDQAATVLVLVTRLLSLRFLQRPISYVNAKRRGPYSDLKPLAIGVLDRVRREFADQ